MEQETEQEIKQETEQEKEQEKEEEEEQEQVQKHKSTLIIKKMKGLNSIHYQDSKLNNHKRFQIKKCIEDNNRINIQNAYDVLIKSKEIKGDFGGGMVFGYYLVSTGKNINGENLSLEEKKELEMNTNKELEMNTNNELEMNTNKELEMKINIKVVNELKEGILKNFKKSNFTELNETSIGNLLLIYEASLITQDLQFKEKIENLLKEWLRKCLDRRHIFPYFLSNDMRLVF